MERFRSVIASLFDTSFDHFVTLRLVKALYWLTIASLAVILAISLVTGLVQAKSFFGGVGVLIFTPLVGLFVLLLVRVWLEMIIVLFRLGETATEVRELLAVIAEKGKGGDRV